jgi:hypothetical protein
MATNIPPKHYDQIRVAINQTTETTIQIPDVRTLRYAELQCAGAQNCYISRTPNGTLSADNYWTIKSGATLPLRDIELQPLNATGDFWYVRSATSADYLEVIYAQ